MYQKSFNWKDNCLKTVLFINSTLFLGFPKRHKFYQVSIILLKRNKLQVYEFV